MSSLKSKAIALAASTFAIVAMTTTTGCNSKTDEPVVAMAPGAARDQKAAEARSELYSIVSDYHSLRMHGEGDFPRPIILTTDMLDPADISPGLIVINASKPQAAQLEILGREVKGVSDTFGRMYYDRFTEGPHTTLYSKEELEDIGDEAIKRGADLENRYEKMLKKAQQAGIIVQSTSYAAQPTAER